jgi:hypothetical protein
MADETLDPQPDLSAAQPDSNATDIAGLINSVASRAQGAPMVKGGRPAIDRNQVPRPDVPAVYKFIRQMVNPAYGTPAGQRVPSRAGAFEDFLGRFFQGFSAGMQTPPGPGANMRAAGAAMQAPYKNDVERFQLQQQADENQARIEQQRAQTAQTQVQTQRMQTTSPIVLPNGQTMMVPNDQLKSILGPVIRGGVQEDVANKNIASREKIAAIKEGIGLPVPPELAQEIGRPDLAGKMLGKNGWDGINKALTAAGKNIQVGDIGNGHVGTFNKATNQIIKDFGPGQRLVSTLQGAQARAYWQAKYGLVAVQDENGTHYESRLNAPGMATAQHSFDVVKGKAGLANYKDALGRMSDSMDILNDTGQRMLVAQTLRQIGTNHDPGFIGSTIGNMVSEGLDPKAADLVAATLQAREFIGANRQFAGNFQGSEALYQRMISNVPGPQNSVELNRKLIAQDLANTARIDEQLRKFQGGKQKPLTIKRDANGRIVSVE